MEDPAPDRHVEQLRALFELRDVLQTASSFEAMYEAAFDAMERILRADRASIQLFENGSTRFIAERGLSPAYVRAIEARWTSIFDPCRPETFVSEAIAEDGRESLAARIVEEGIRSLVSVPLVAQGRLLGKFVVYCTEERPFSDEEIGFAETIANNVAFAIDRKRSDDAVFAHTERLELALDASNMGTWDWDPHTDRVTLDRRAIRMWGLPEDSREATREALLARLREEDREPIAQALAQAVADRRRLHVTGHVPWHDGSLRTIDVRGRCHFDERGRPHLVSGVCHDATAQVEAARETEQLRQRLEESRRLESLGILAGGVAHDFNNLLVGVMGSLRVVEEEVSEGSAAAEALETMRTATERAAALARQMLAYSGQGSIRVEDADLGTIAHDTQRIVRRTLPRETSLEWNGSSDPLPVRGDATQLGQVVMNLLVNAGDAIGDGGGRIRLRVGQRLLETCDVRRIRHCEGMQPGLHAFVEVEDDGCGMAPDIQDRVFDPFFTTKFTGRGLGLGAALGMIRAHGGGIQVRSALDVGTTFTVYVPVAPSANRTPEVDHDEGRTDDGPAHGMILVVDDDALVRKVFDTTLRAAGYETLCLGEPKEALDVFRARPTGFRLAILDVTMPGMSGLDLLEALRGVSPDLPVILCSGYAAEDAHRYPEDVDVLPKPFATERLLSKVRNPHRPGDRVRRVHPSPRSSDA